MTAEETEDEVLLVTTVLKVELACTGMSVKAEENGGAYCWYGVWIPVIAEELERIGRATEGEEGMGQYDAELTVDNELSWVGFTSSEYELHELESQELNDGVLLAAALDNAVDGVGEADMEAGSKPVSSKGKQALGNGSDKEASVIEKSGSSSL